MDPANPSAAAAAAPAPYRVLARTYRPARLSELIGQEALVRTLRNAFASGRIAHAFLLTGIRGVGKTTTARILAKALNCTGLDGKGGPTPEPCGACPSCRGIEEGRSLDVIELDAASHTGIGDMRELLEGVMFGPAASRFKVYVLDEVHMLSEKAWNSLLKTVEEPPPHAKFVFATTEARKVPVTVLSRCQRFDLRRVPADALARHLASVCGREGAVAEAEALALIARAAEGSVRDSLSLLDQAIALSEGAVAVGTVQDMLGLGDRLRVLELLEAVTRGDAAGALDRFGELHGLGADPLALVQDLLEICHTLSRLKVRPEATAAAGLAGDLAARARAMAEALSLPVLARAWQMLLRGLDEVRVAPDGAAAAEMLLLRLACVSELPPPSELARLARGGAPALGGATGRAAAAPTPSVAPAPVAAAPTPAPAAGPRDYAELVELLRRSGEPLLAAFLAEETHLIRFEPGRIELRLGAGVSPKLPGQLAEAAGRVTGRRWIVAVGAAGGDAPLAAQADARRERRIAELRDNPALRPLLEAFPGADIVDVRQPSAGAAATIPTITSAAG